jgi:hypothetical protein
MLKIYKYCLIVKMMSEIYIVSLMRNYLSILLIVDLIKIFKTNQIVNYNTNLFLVVFY